MSELAPNKKAPQPVSPLARAGSEGGSLPVFEVDGYRIYRDPVNAIDFVWPFPSPDETCGFYAQPEYFGGEIKGGYRNYHEQTAPVLPLFETFLDRFEPVAAHKSVLDVGCGYGMHLEAAAKRGWECYGVEISRHARDAAQTRLGANAYIVESVDELPPHRFDLVVLLDVIEHLADPTQLFFRLLSIGAIDASTTVVVTTPNARSNVAMQKGIAWEYLHPPSHLVYYSGEGLKRLFERLKFEDISVQGIFPTTDDDVALPGGEPDGLNGTLCGFGGIMGIAKGSQFSDFMHERYVPGTWSEITRYEHLPRYVWACNMARGKRVLDFACGSGYGSAHLAEVADSVLGVDLNEKALAWAESEYGASGARFERNTDLGASLPRGRFDLVTAFEVIEHIAADGQRMLLENLKALLAPGGAMLVSTPNPAVTALYGENEFHLHELSEQEFIRLVSEVFPYVTFYRQSLGSGVMFHSAAAPTGSHPSVSSLGDLARLEVACWIALCSMSPLDMPDPMLVWDAEQPYIASHIDHERRITEIKSRFMGAMCSMREYEQRVAKYEHRVADLIQSRNVVRERLQESLGLAGELAAQLEARVDSTKRFAQMRAAVRRTPAALAKARLLAGGRRAVLGETGGFVVQFGVIFRQELSPGGAAEPFIEISCEAGSSDRPKALHFAVGMDWESSLIRMRELAAGLASSYAVEIAVPNHFSGLVADPKAGVTAISAGGETVAILRALQDTGSRLIHLHVDGALDVAWLQSILRAAKLADAPLLATTGIGGSLPAEVRSALRACVLEGGENEIGDHEVKRIPPLMNIAAARNGIRPRIPFLFVRLRFDGSAEDQTILQSMIETLGQHADLRAAIYGDGDGFAAIVKNVRGGWVRDRIYFLGRMPFNAIVAAMSACALAVMDHDWLAGTFGCLWSVTPLVALRPGLLDGLGPCELGQPDFSASLTERMDWMLAHPGEAARIISRRQRQAAAAAATNAASAAYEALYREVAGK